MPIFIRRARTVARRTTLLLALLALAAWPVITMARDTARATTPAPSAADRADAATSFSHATWTAVLQRHVDRDGWVDYVGLARDRADLDRYLASLRAVGPTATPDRFPTHDDALAYYINAYNALVFEGVLARKPATLKSVWGTFGIGYGFFVGMKVELDGLTTNLKKLEDVQIREGFGDPRIHAALNCASIGCPRLPQMAFEPATLDAQLDAAMREFARGAAHVQHTPGSREVGLSKIFSWFQSDFVDWERAQADSAVDASASDDRALVAYVNRFRDADAQLPTGADLRVTFLPYDKGLNRQ
ncbi:MAG: DUF547 domain-containing protein [Acidobacteriota bacterium]